MRVDDITFDSLLRLEPRLRLLLEEIQQIDPANRYYNDERAWAREYKPRMKQLVGGIRPYPGLDHRYHVDPLPQGEFHSIGEVVQHYLPKYYGITLLHIDGLVSEPELILHSSEAYEVAYKTLYDALPRTIDSSDETDEYADEYYE
jgi:hypothetical protein